MMISATLKEWGNSYGFRVSKKTAQALKLRPDQEVFIQISPKMNHDGFGMFKGAKPFTRAMRDELQNEKP